MPPIFTGPPTPPPPGGPLFTGAPDPAGDPRSLPGAAQLAIAADVMGSDRLIFGQGNQTSRIFDWNPDQAGPALPHVDLFSSIWGTGSKIYSWKWDEAYKRSRQDALAMLRDCWLTSLIDERRYPTAQMSWHLEPENKADPAQKCTTDYLTDCAKALPDLEDMLFQALWAVWYGRAGIQFAWTYEQIQGRKSMTAQSFFPINGDKIQFSWSGEPAIKIYTASANDLKKQHPQTEIRQSDTGMVLVLNTPYWRDRFLIHKHDCIDADFHESEMHGGIHGVGLRHWCYWIWWIKEELQSWMTDFMERVGLGMTIYYYEAGNKAAQNEAARIAKQQGRNTWVVWPREPGQSGAVKGVERTEPSTSGADFIVKLMEYFDKKIERKIIGQSMSSGADNESGLGGSGRAAFAKDTKYHILRHDARKLQSTLTRDFIRPMQRWNCPEAKYPIRWVFDIDTPDPVAKLDAVKSAWEIGVSFDEDEARGLTGMKKPEGDAVVLKNPQIAAAAQQAQGVAPEQPAAAGPSPATQLFGKPLFGAAKEGAKPAPEANGTNGAHRLFGGPALEYDKKRDQLVRYGKGKEDDVKLALYVYRDGKESESIPIGEHDQWEAFAGWAADQGGELARLAHEGHSDPWRPMGLVDLDKQLAAAPEKYHALAERIRDAIREHADVEGIMVSEERP